MQLKKIKIHNARQLCSSKTEKQLKQHLDQQDQGWAGIKYVY